MKGCLKFFFILMLSACCDDSLSGGCSLLGSYSLEMNENNPKTLEEWEDADLLEKQKQEEVAAAKGVYVKEKTLVIFIHGMGDSEKREGSWEFKKNDPLKDTITENECAALKKNFKLIGGDRVVFEFAPARETINIEIKQQAGMIAWDVNGIIQNPEYNDCTRVVFLGYSMGGLVAEYLAVNDVITNYDYGRKICFSLVTLGSPVLGINYDKDLELALKVQCEQLITKANLAIKEESLVKDIWRGTREKEGVYSIIKEALESKAFKFIFDSKDLIKKKKVEEKPVMISKGIRDMLRVNRTDDFISKNIPNIPILNIVSRISGSEIFKYFMKRYFDLEYKGEVSYEDFCSIIDNPEVREEVNPIFDSIFSSLKKKIEAQSDEYGFMRHDGKVSSLSQLYDSSVYTNCKSEVIISHHNELPSKISVVTKVLNFVNEQIANEGGAS